jgi:hypothetical protein
MVKNAPPSGLESFSQGAIRKAISGRILQTPIFLYPSALGILGLLAVGVIGVSPLLVGAASGGLAVGALGLAWQFSFRRDQLTRDYLNQLHESINSRRQLMLQGLSTRMEELHFDQGLGQLEQLQAKFTNFVGILNQALPPEEITYGRYLGIAEQVYLSSLDNLEQAVGALTSIRTINPAQLRNRIEAIHADGVVTATESVEQDSLNQRQQLFDRQLERVATLVAQNEQAMTKLDFTAAAMADLRTAKGQASMDMESAMTELQRLIEKAPEYRQRP